MKRPYTLTFLGRCSDINQDTWDKLMRGARKKNPKLMHLRIGRDVPELRDELFLDMPVEANPYRDATYTKKVTSQRDEVPELGVYVGDTIDIYTNSATEYFFRRDYDITDNKEDELY